MDRICANSILAVMHCCYSKIRLKFCFILSRKWLNQKHSHNSISDKCRNRTKQKPRARWCFHRYTIAWNLTIEIFVALALHARNICSTLPSVEIGCPWGTHDCITAEHFNFPHIPVSIVGITEAGWKLNELVVPKVNDKFVQPAKEDSVGCNQECEKQIQKLINISSWIEEGSPIKMVWHDPWEAVGREVN